MSVAPSAGPRLRKNSVLLKHTVAPAAVLAGTLLAMAATFFSPAARAAATNPNPDCTLIMPAHPLSAAGLATPYQLTATDPAKGACHEYNTAQSAFVQAVIFDPNTGNLAVYNPLVIDKGTKPAAATVVPKLPDNAIVALWFGYNGNALTLQPARGENLGDANCKDGDGNTVFGQFAYCNAKHFFRKVNRTIDNGDVTPPVLGTAKDGQPCPTVRDFFVVDQDQSDNLPTQYLVTPNGKIAQYTQKNLGALQGATVLANPSDNRLTSIALAAALTCTPWKAEDLADPGQMVPALALDELMARFNQATPVAMVPAGDPMAQDNGDQNLGKVNRYRRGVDQPTVDSASDASTARYCRQMLRAAPTRMFASATQPLLAAAPSPDPNAANSLFTFMAQRFQMSWQMLDCQNLTGQADPISVAVNKANVAVGASLNTKVLNKSLQKIAGQQARDDWADSSERSQQAED